MSDKSDDLTLEALVRKMNVSLLKSEATEKDIERLCKEATRNRFASICVASTWLRWAGTAMRRSGVEVFSTVGFPHGNMFTTVKAMEARFAVAQGVQGIEMVMSAGHLITGDVPYMHFDVRDVVGAAGEIPVTVILETGLLSNDRIALGCRIAKEAGAKRIKTSTGFRAAGKTENAIRIIREAVGLTMEIEASGDIHTEAQARKLLALGATSIGVDLIFALAIATGNAKGDPSEKQSRPVC